MLHKDYLILVSNFNQYRYIGTGTVLDYLHVVNKAFYGTGNVRYGAVLYCTVPALTVQYVGTESFNGIFCDFLY